MLKVVLRTNYKGRIMEVDLERYKLIRIFSRIVREIIADKMSFNRNNLKC